MFTDAFNVGETRAHRALYASLAIALAVAFAILNAPFRVPAHPGVDQMSYLVGGRLLAEHGSTTFHALNPVTHQPDPFRFTGRMWVSMDAGTPNERYHPLHPLGYATTIRYTEGLMLLPVLVVMGLRAHRERTARDTLLPLAAWAVPVVAVLLFNQITIGTWTGYRSGRNLDFGWTFFRTNWAIVFHLLSSEGLFLVFPLALAGLPLMFRRNARLALVLAAWILPNAALYTSYYWAPDNLGYLRYFFTIFPALLVCAFWWLPPALEAVASRTAAAIAIGALALLSAAAGLHSGLANAAADCAENSSLQQRAANVLAAAPAGSVVFTQDMGLLNHLQLAGDYALYDLAPLTRSALLRRADADPEGEEERRLQWKPDVDPRLAALTHKEIVRRQNGIAAECLDAGLRVFVVRDLEPIPAGFAPADDFPARVITQWTGPVREDGRTPGLVELSRPHPHAPSE